MNVGNPEALERQDSKSGLADYDLKQSIEDTIQEMFKEKEENPGLIIPKRFLEIFNCPEMVALLNTIKDYLKELFKLEAK